MSVRRLHRTLGILLAIAAVFALAACSKIPGSTKKETAAAAVIDEFTVPYELLRYYVRNHMDSYAAGDGGYWTAQRAEEMTESIYADTFASLREQYAVFSLCKQYGIDRGSDTITELVNTEVQAVIEACGGEDAYVDELKANYMNDSVFRFFTTVSVCRDELFYAMLNAGELETDETVLKEMIESEAFVRVKQILVTSETAGSQAQALARAEAVRDLALSGEDFDSLVREYGEDLYMFQNTDGYYMCRGVWYHGFEDAAFDLQIGEVSPVIETPAGYSILLRCEKDENYLTEHFEELCDDYRDAQFCLALEEKAASMTVTRQSAMDGLSILDIE